ncbi:MAG: hypothetical protein NT045_02535, partial [Candidatus Aureabacteria bacterium]|nr:hypothetical protein [Candidatus Auribacterota bacterium]
MKGALRDVFSYAPRYMLLCALLSIFFLCCLPLTASAQTVIPSDNDHSALFLHISKNNIYPGEPLMLSFDISAVPLRVSGYVVFVTPDGEIYSLRGDGSFAQGIYPIITDAGPIDRPITLDIPALLPSTVSAGSYKVYAALVAYPSKLSRSGYLGFDSAEFNVTEEVSAAEAARESSNILTITTYTGYYEGHLITFPDSTTMSIDCASGSITTKSHFHADHCAACGSGDYNRNNVAPGDVIYSNGGVTVTVVAANKKVIGEEKADVTCPASDENPNSMALWVKYGGFDYL